MADVPKLHRTLCPVCLGFQGGQCDRCNGTGYVLVSPYAEGRGEQGLDDGELREERLRVRVIELEKFVTFAVENADSFLDTLDSKYLGKVERSDARPLREIGQVGRPLLETKKAAS